MKNRYPTNMVDFLPSNELLPNPHKGFCSFQRFRGDKINETEEWNVNSGWKMEELTKRENIDARIYGDGYPDPTVAYFRLPWRMLEPEEGEYDFSMIDFVLDEAGKRGQKVIFRFYPNVNRPGSCELPEWFRKKCGITEERELLDKSTPITPDYFNAFSALIRRIGAHIDGDKRISSIDIAFISAWGENAQIDMVPDEYWMMLADAYLDAFPSTPLTTQFQHAESIRYLNERRPVGLRADCIGDMRNHMHNQYPRTFLEFDYLWKKAPISLEVCWVMKYWLEMGWDIDFIIEESLRWHLSTFNEKSARIPEELMPKVNEWIKRMGYRFAIRMVDYPSRAQKSDILHIDIFLENRGVAPIYHKYPFVLRLRGKGAVYDFPTDADIREWLPGGHKRSFEITLPKNIERGTYTLEAGITDGEERILIATDAPRCDGFTELCKIEIFTPMTYVHTP